MFEWLWWILGYRDIDPEVEYQMLYKSEMDNIRDYFKSLKTT
jgi:hypothetical protein